MDWDKLRIFYTVAEAGSFTRAGEKLNLSQSAVSRQISTLEDSIGMPLFHRHARGLILTEAGEILNKEASDIFTKLTMLEAQLADTKQLPKGPIRVTVANFIGSSWLAPKLAEFRELYPDIQVTVIFEDRVLNLGMREADAAIRLHKPEQPDLVQRHLATIPFHICASKAYLDNHDRPKTLTDLKKHTLIGYPEDVLSPYANQNWLFENAAIDIKTAANAIMLNSLTGIYEAAIHDVGITTLPDYMIEKANNLEVILPKTLPPPVDIYFVYPEERRHSKRIAIFRDFLLKKISEESKKGLKKTA